ncbi:MAG TPA: hypothetical protein VKZ66_02920 [Pusillimonas sp.]|uniref:hypothetical protein n=1 Tax=Pusillimonas sp. TaxID=3040095 RepID=UPI002B4B39A9|nr:hypothetical protein [Pusillimonas sp.]HLU18886.1 hypothetical protein [Pusillimonas sp.]
MESMQPMGAAARRTSSDSSANLMRHWDKAILPAVFVVMLLAFYLLDPRTLSVGNLTNVLTQVSILAIVTIGASVVIFSGGFDLSAGAVVALTAVLVAGQPCGISWAFPSRVTHCPSGTRWSTWRLTLTWLTRAITPTCHILPIPTSG